MVGVPKSTVAYWSRKLDLSARAEQRIAGRIHKAIRKGLVARNRRQTLLARERASHEQGVGRADAASLSPRELMLVGAALYWAEGYKRPKVYGGKERTGHAISFVNADEDMIRLFVRFLRETLCIPDIKMRAAMRLYPGISETQALEYWMGVTSLPSGAFRKTTWLISGASRGRRPADRLPFGTLQIEVGDTQKFHRLMGWIAGMKCSI